MKQNKLSKSECFSMSLQTLKQSARHLNVFFLYTQAQEWLVKWSQSEHIPKNPVCFSDQSSVNMSEVFYNLKLPDNLIQFLGQPVNIIDKRRRWLISARHVSIHVSGLAFGVHSSQLLSWKSLFSILCFYLFI